jgi:hypothetical protein
MVVLVDTESERAYYLVNLPSAKSVKITDVFEIDYSGYYGYGGYY